VRRFSSLPRLAKYYVGSVILLGGASIVFSAVDLATTPRYQQEQWLLLAFLTLLSGSITVKVPSVPATISVSETFVFTAVILLGASAGTMTVALDGLIISLWLRRKKVEAYRVLFNVAAPSLAIFLSAKLYYVLASTYPLSYLEATATRIHTLLPQLIAFTMAYFLLNSWLIAFAISWEKRLSALRVWRENFFWLSLNFFGGASVAALMVAYSRQVNASAVGVIVPLLIISYLTNKTSMGRLEDATRHLSEINSLYLSTIETLAMAIDAKDQITHGHIRRVQTYAIGLAKHLGVRDESLLKALEAAALLHDIGKIGVPEYILNKPGRLSPAEFEQMKLHASIGGDLVATIHFRDLVAPIVRHHHESWDGKGYPDGLSGTDIPIGARILAVVDCFDALTSDRPYRPRLADEAALAILMDRRGTMYDPLVVDTFFKVFPELSKECLEPPIERPAVARLKQLVGPGSTRAETPAFCSHIVARGSDELLSLLDLASVSSGELGLADFAEMISKHLRKITPACTCIFFIADPNRDVLAAQHVFGVGGEQLQGQAVRQGHNVSGWVAVNRQIVVNAEASLDLGELARATNPQLRSCLAAPLLAGDDLVGVLTLYSDAALAFSEDHRRLIEMISSQISRKVSQAIEVDRFRAAALWDSVTGLPNLKRLNQLVAPPESLLASAGQPIALIVLSVVDLDALSRKLGSKVEDSVLSHISVVVRSALRAGDILFRSQNDEFLVLLTQTDIFTAQAIAERIVAHVGGEPYVSPDGVKLQLALEFGVAAERIDDRTLDELLISARSRMFSRPGLAGDTLSTVH
jgi:diguanylate cyclase (GGDEF)-like protein